MNVHTPDDFKRFMEDKGCRFMWVVGENGIETQCLKLPAVSSYSHTKATALYCASLFDNPLCPEQIAMTGVWRNGLLYTNDPPENSAIRPFCHGFLSWKTSIGINARRMSQKLLEEIAPYLDRQAREHYPDITKIEQTVIRDRARYAYITGEDTVYLNRTDFLSAYLPEQLPAAHLVDRVLDADCICDNLFQGIIEEHRNYFVSRALRQRLYDQFYQEIQTAPTINEYCARRINLSIPAGAKSLRARVEVGDCTADVRMPVSRLKSGETSYRVDDLKIRFADNSMRKVLRGGRGEQRWIDADKIIMMRFYRETVYIKSTGGLHE